MTSPLIRADHLRRLVADDAVTVLDVRYRLGDPAGRQQHLAGHVPGAVYVDLDTDLAAPPGPEGRHPLPEPTVFEAAMRRAGVSGERPVVVYDDWSGHAAARAWWLLRHHGHPDVRLLDGGWAAWHETGGEIATGQEHPAPGDFRALPGRLPIVDVDSVTHADVLIDARAPERFRGESEPVDPVAGHIPGARNVPTTRNLDETGRFRSPDDLRATYAEVGAEPGRRVAVYCGSGITAAHDVLALEIAGVGAALYPGSWSEWVADPERPVATGPADA